MRFFLDENFPKTATKLLIKNDHDVFDIRGTSDEGAEDVDIFQMAQKEKAVLLTTDKDIIFSRTYFPCGIIFLVIFHRVIHRQDACATI